MPNSTREDTDVRGSLVLVPVALVVLLISGLWAWKLASSQFAPVPVISSPGNIVVATYGHATNRNPIRAYLAYSASRNQRSVNYFLSLSQQDTSGATGNKSTGIVIFLCGEAARNPSLLISTPFNEDQAAIWHDASHFDVYTLGASGLAFSGQCIFTLLSMVFDPETANNEVVLRGFSGPPPSKVSGNGIIYAWPGIYTLPQADSANNLTAVPLVKGSTYTVGFADIPNDLSNMVTNPDLTPSSGGLQTAESFNRGFTGLIPEFRLSGELSNSQATGQRNLFIAGALVGVAGAAAIWFLELLTKLLLTL